jgi:hypothetical protein
MRGEYDSFLKWPFNNSLLLCLYDMSSKRDHIVQTLTPYTHNEGFSKATNG